MNKAMLRITVIRRCVSSTAAASGSNKEWKAMRREEKERRDAKWRRRRDSNPFKGNVGVARKMKGLGIDPDDPAVDALASNLDPGLDAASQMEELYEMTDRAGYEFYPARKRHLANRPSAETLSRILTAKRCFPQKPDPELLTWMERLMISHLNKSDPVTWSAERLAEAYPATEKTIKKIIKDKHQLRPEKVRPFDEAVRENWKKLSSGDLEISDELRSHLEANNFGTGEDKLMTAETRYRVEREVLVNYAKSLEMPRIQPGQFGSIVADYNKKVAAKGQKEGAMVDTMEAKVDLVGEKMASRDLFSEGSFDSQFGVPSPYRETALIQSNVDLRKERKMTLDKFRRKYLDQVRPTASMRALMPPSMDKRERARVSHREKFAEWLRNEKAKDSMASSSGPSKLEAKEVLLDLDEEAPVSKYKQDKGLDGYSTSVPDFVGDASDESGIVRDDNIQIPAAKFKRGAVYRKGNEFFNDRGEFLYRLPVETMGER